jgi:hypothetical protein
MRSITERLRDTPNWRKESFGDWKSMTSSYDRSPFTAAKRIEQYEALLLALLTYGRDPSANHQKDDSARGRWVSFTVPVDFIEEVEKLVAESEWNEA